MSVIELKKELINRLGSIEEIDILEDVSRLLDVDLPEQEVYYLNDEQKQAVAEARHQISMGNFYINEDVERQSQEWLKE